MFQVLQVGSATPTPDLDTWKCLLQLPIQFSKLNGVTPIQLRGFVQLSMTLWGGIAPQLPNTSHPIGLRHIPVVQGLKKIP